MLHRIDQGILEDRKHLQFILYATAMFLSSTQPNRQKCGAKVGLAALAALGLLGGGLAVGASDSCGLRGIFGNFQDQSKADAENIHRWAGFQDPLTTYATKFTTYSNEKFYLVENELAGSNTSQAGISETRDKNWANIEEQLVFYEKIFHSLCE